MSAKERAVTGLNAAAGGDEDLGAGTPRPVEDEVALAPPVVKKERSITRPLDAFEELLGDDLVGVDVGSIERAQDPGGAGEGVHPLSALTSTRCPAIAAAAAIGGGGRGGRRRTH